MPDETSADGTGGREALSDERLAELKRLANEVCTCGSSDCDEGTQFGLTPSQANELLAEVERLNEVLHASTVIRNAAESTSRLHKSLVSALREDRNKAREEWAAAAQRAETVERALAEMRERIALGLERDSNRLDQDAECYADERSPLLRAQAEALWDAARDVRSGEKEVADGG